MLDVIKHGSQIIAIIIRASYKQAGIQFVTPDEFSQQMACICYPNGHVIDAHVHNPVHRDVTNTLEALFIKEGVLRVDLYSSEKQYLESQILRAGDVIFLASGGHGFEVIETVNMIEIKQGPYSGDRDKSRFEGVSVERMVIK